MTNHDVLLSFTEPASKAFAIISYSNPICMGVQHMARIYDLHVVMHGFKVLRSTSITALNSGHTVVALAIILFREHNKYYDSTDCLLHILYVQ